MNTKHRILSVLLILATVATLCVVMAAPASAVITGVTVAPAPATAGTAAQYTIAGTGVAIGATTTTIVFPAGTVVPATIATGNVTVTGGGVDGARTVTAVVATPSALTPTVAITHAATTVVQTVTVVIAAGAGIVNPGPGAAYTATMANNIDGAVASGAYTVTGIGLSLYTGAVGTTIAITGIAADGWANGSYIATKWDGVAITTAPASPLVAAAAFTAAVAVPASVAGPHTLSVSDGATTKTSGFIVTPSIVSFSPTSGAAGSTFTVVGSGFTGGLGVTIKTTTLGVTIGGGTVGADGSFIVTCGAAATDTIKATDGTGRNATSAGTFTLTPKVVLNPATGLVGSTIQVVGTGFTASGTITACSIAGAPQAMTPVTPAVDATGATTFTIPVPANQNSGTNVVVVTDSGLKTGTGVYSVTARAVTASPNSGQGGTTVVLSASGFKASTAAAAVTVTVVFRDAAATATTVITGGVVDSSGNFQGSFAVPANPVAGSGSITVTDTATNSASASFTVSPALITLSPTSGSAGTTVTVTGTGFAAYATLTNLTCGAANVTPIPSVVADALGTFTATFVVPGGGLGATAITATAGGVTPASAVFTASSTAVAVTSGLNTIAGKYTIVWAFDAATQSWKMYDTTAGATSTLSGLTVGQGYWMNITQDCTLVYGGYTYALKAGWNLIGWR